MGVWCLRGGKKGSSPGDKREKLIGACDLPTPYNRGCFFRVAFQLRLPIAIVAEEILYRGVWGLSTHKIFNVFLTIFRLFCTAQGHLLYTSIASHSLHESRADTGSRGNTCQKN